MHGGIWHSLNPRWLYIYIVFVLYGNCLCPGTAYSVVLNVCMPHINVHLIYRIHIASRWQHEYSVAKMCAYEYEICWTSVFVWLSFSSASLLSGAPNVGNKSLKLECKIGPNRSCFQTVGNALRTSSYTFLLYIRQNLKWSGILNVSVFQKQKLWIEMNFVILLYICLPSFIVMTVFEGPALHI